MTRAPVRSTQILVILAVTNLVSYAARNALFAVVPDLKLQYGIDDAQVGLLQTVFMIPHAAATLGFGWAGDRFDRRRVIGAGMILASVAGALGAIGSSYLGLGISRAVVGFGTAAVVPVANSILGQIFDGPQKASRIAVFNLGLFVGGVVGFAAGTAFHFPLVVVVLAVPGVVLAALVAALPVPVPVVPPTAIVVDPASSIPGAAAPPTARRSTLPSAGRVPPRPGWRDFTAAVKQFIADSRVLLRIRTLRWLIVSTTVMAFAAGAYNAWLKEFLVRDKGLSDSEATSLLSLALCGGLSGILVGGRISDRLRARNPAGRMWTIVMGMALTAPCAAIALLLPRGIALDVTGVATLFFISWYHAPMAATVDDLAPAQLTAAAQGLVIFTMHMVGTAPSSWVVGEISKHSSLGEALWVPTGALVVAAACMAIASRSFAADHQRARWDGTTPQDSL